MTVSKRQPAGIPIGGQFAAQAHAEADVVLVEDRAPRSELTFDGAMVLRAARSVADRRRLSRAMRDEIVGETAYEVTKTVRNGESAGQPVALNGAYAAGVAKHVVAKLTTQEQQSYDRYAIAEYHRLLAASEQEMGRMLTVAEEDGLADSIRSAQLPSRRASPGFHRRNHTPVALRRVHVIHAEERGPLPASDFDEGSLGDRLLVSLEAGGKRSEAALQAWDALAEHFGVPAVRKGTYRGRGYEAAQRVVREAGGARAIAAAWRADDPEDQTTLAAAGRLFEPFGAEGFDEQRAVVAMILGAGDYGDDLWRAASRAASDEGPPT